MNDSIPDAAPTTMHDLNIVRAYLIALVVETLNIGISTTLCTATAQILLRKERGKLNRHLLATLCLIWVLSVAHWIIDIVRASQAFIDSAGRAAAYYSVVSTPLEAAKTGVYITITLVADHFMIYRVFVVWNRNRLIVILPILLWIATAISGYTVTHVVLLAGSEDVFFPALAPWALSFFTMSLSLNAVCTLLIAGRLMMIEMRVGTMRSGNSYVHSVLVVFLESAAMYSLSLIVLLVLYALGSNAQYILVDWTPSLIGIAFSLIIYRLAAANSVVSASTPSSRQEGTNPYPLTNVNVTHFVETHREKYDLERSINNKGPREEL
ncbi:hypothetical protein MSAN_00264100 [Mycena sanguinolenta]|uniref:Uncharacterized protein n=1 Tax=Mycena sanguinolenta TaxID=230812 RepID=A0A8H6ZG62_9AGAR|nr:hypothetical protein MSAN_00264100 [Mycena sanguinolenta]